MYCERTGFHGPVRPVNVVHIIGVMYAANWPDGAMSHSRGAAGAQSEGAGEGLLRRKSVSQQASPPPAWRSHLQEKIQANECMPLFFA